MSVRAIVIDGRYKKLEMGSIHSVERLSTTSLKLEGISREYHPRICAYVNDDNARITMAEAIQETRRKE